MKASVYIATSLDGFIARKNGEIDWLMKAGDPDSPEDYGYKEFSNTVDCLVMGRNTLEKVMTFPEWPYEGKRVVVLSKTMTDIPKQLLTKIELYSGSLTALVNRLQKEACKRLYIDGGKTVQSFLNENLITDLTITTIPILLGEGLPLFGKVTQDKKLKHIATQAYPSGFVKSTYEIHTS